MRTMHGVRSAGMALLLTALVGCGQIENEPGSPAGTLCFDYFQRCVYPLALDMPLPVDTNNDGIFEPPLTCSNSNCHASTGTGGGLVLTPGSSPVIASAAQARGTPMHTNFISAKGRADLTNPRGSALLQKPLFEVNHGGGRIFMSDQDAAAQQILFWISNRVPPGGDEFAPSCATLFNAGLCQSLP